MANKKAMFVLFVKLTVISTLMDVLRERVLIVPPHNRLFSFSVGVWPRLPTQTLVHLSRAPKQCRVAVLLQRATVGQSPGGGVFSDKSAPNLVPALNCFFVISSMWMSVWLSCGSMDSLCSDTLHDFHQDIDSAAFLLLLSHNPPSSIVFLTETYFLASLMKHEIQAFILALAGI